MRTFRFMLPVLVVGAAWLIQGALAKDPPGDVNAARQARDRFMQSHQQTGAISNGYRPNTAYAYHQSATAHAQALSSYQGVEKVPVATVQEHLDEIQRNTKATSQELGKIDSEHAQQADIHKLVTTANEQLAAASKHTAAAQEELSGKTTVSSVPYHQEIHRALNSAAAAHREILKHLGIEAH